MIQKKILVAFFILLILKIEYVYTKRRRPSCTLPILPNGFVRLRARGRIAKLRCRPGFVMYNGDRRLMCVAGKWLGSVPFCISNGCLPFHVLNGNVLELYNGALVQVECNPGYKINGTSSVKCDGKNWNNYPTCQVPLPDPDHLSCNFEFANICNWKQDNLDDFDWSFEYAITAFIGGNSVSKYDHTYGDSLNGHYVMALPTSKQFPQISRLFSPIFNTPVHFPACVAFYFYGYGHSTNLLNVYIRPESLPFEFLMPVWTQKLSFFKEYWRLAFELIEINIVGEKFQVIIEAVFNSSGPALLVDDFLVTSGKECIDIDFTYTRSRNTLKLFQTEPFSDFTTTIKPTTVTNKPNLGEKDLNTTISSCNGTCLNVQTTQETTLATVEEKTQKTNFPLQEDTTFPITTKSPSTFFTSSIPITSPKLSSMMPTRPTIFYTIPPSIEISSTKPSSTEISFAISSSTELFSTKIFPTMPTSTKLSFTTSSSLSSPTTHRHKFSIIPPTTSTRLIEIITHRPKITTDFLTLPRRTLTTTKTTITNPTTTKPTTNLTTNPTTTIKPTTTNHRPTNSTTSKNNRPTLTSERSLQKNTITVFLNLKTVSFSSITQSTTSPTFLTKRKTTPKALLTSNMPWWLPVSTAIDQTTPQTDKLLSSSLSNEEKTTDSKKSLTKVIWVSITIILFGIIAVIGIVIWKKSQHQFNVKTQTNFQRMENTKEEDTNCSDAIEETSHSMSYQRLQNLNMSWTAPDVSNGTAV